MEVNKKWLSIPEEFRKELRENVFCGKCLDAVTIENFTIEENSLGIILRGKCKDCGSNVARVVEMD